jgi:hypothetical protein
MSASTMSAANTQAEVSGNTAYYSVDYYARNKLQQVLKLGAGDSRLLLNVLPRELADVAFQTLQQEIPWSNMKNRGVL